MMIMSLGVDGSHVYKQIELMEKAIAKVERESYKALNRTMRALQLGWGMIQGAIRAAGGSISMTTRLVVSAGFGAIQALAPLLVEGGIVAAISKDPLLIAQVIAGIAQMATSIAALVAYQSDERALSQQLRGASFMINNISGMLYAWS